MTENRLSQLNQLPDTETLKKRLKSVALLHALYEPDGYSTCCTYTPKEQSPLDIEYFIFEYGDGNFILVLFSGASCLVRGYDANSAMARAGKNSAYVVEWLKDEMEDWSRLPWPHIFSTVPEHWHQALIDSAALCEDLEFTSYCLWNENSQWAMGEVELCEKFKGKSPDGFHMFHRLLMMQAKEMKSWADETYQHKVSQEVVKEILNHTPIQKPLLIKLIKQGNRQDDDPGDLKRSLEELITVIQYPNNLV